MKKFDKETMDQLFLVTGSADRDRQEITACTRMMIYDGRKRYE